MDVENKKKIKIWKKYENKKYSAVPRLNVYTDERLCVRHVKQTIINKTIDGHCKHTLRVKIIVVVVVVVIKKNNFFFFLSLKRFLYNFCCCFSKLIHENKKKKKLYATNYNATIVFHAIGVKFHRRAMFQRLCRPWKNSVIELFMKSKSSDCRD